MAAYLSQVRLAVGRAKARAAPRIANAVHPVSTWCHISPPAHSVKKKASMAPIRTT